MSAVLEVLNVVGARPNFMKMAPICLAMGRRREIRFRLVHTGQHYDEAMSELFFRELGLPRPDVHLEVGSGGHGEQTGRIMIAFERVVLAERPDLVVVVGDVNSTIACALVAAKLGIRVAHVEAGLRSFDRTMPEEVNRVLTDQLSDYLFTTERGAEANLVREGIDPRRIFFTGNVMIDTLLRCRPLAAGRPILGELGLAPRGYALVTLHRPSNVDDPAQLRRLAEVLATLSRRLPVLFPVHPRTRAKLAALGLEARLEAEADVRLLAPLGYLDFLRCTEAARLVITDSGGVQEETTVLGVPCITARDSTERPVTAAEGTNRVVGTEPDAILAAALARLDEGEAPAARPEGWDGAAAERIVEILVREEVGRRAGRAA